VGGRPPLEVVDCPPTVDVRLFQDEGGKSSQILLINLSTERPLDVGRGPAVFQHVFPQQGIGISLNTQRKVLDVVGLSEEVQVEQVEDGFHILVPKLDLFESIIVKFK
jgi:hypothetical protein